jgi:hypothetical protein
MRPTDDHSLFRRQSAWLWPVVIALLGVGAYRLWEGFGELLWRSALDLTTRTVHVHRWFAGGEFYRAQSSTYPPASYLLLWPIVGWLPFQIVRCVWALLVIVSLGWTMRWCAQTLGGCRVERYFIAAFVLAMTATGRAIFLGQLMPLLLACLTLSMASVAPRAAGRIGWKREFFVWFLMLFALVKPSVSAPFLWLILWSQAPTRVPVGVVLGYAALTVAALWFQNAGLGELSGWAHTVNRDIYEVSEGYANVRAWMGGLGLKAWSHPVSLLILAWLGWWTHRYRSAELWLLLGVVGLVARGWTYHASYDDMLLIFPIIALFRIARDSKYPASTSFQARLLLFGLVLTLLIPTAWVWNVFWLGAAVQGGCSIVWLLVLAFLLRFARANALSR